MSTDTEQLEAAGHAGQKVVVRTKTASGDMVVSGTLIALRAVYETEFVPLDPK
jgi:hypothetical protein